MLARVAEVQVKHDFCYLSNPHATELFLKYFKRDFRDAEKLHVLVGHYPSQNRALAEKVAVFLKHPLLLSPSKEGEKQDISVANIFVGNGATEIIQAVLHNFAEEKILIPIPTFSPYLEFAPKGVKVVCHQLNKEDDFRLNLKKLLTQIQKKKPDTVVVINPNNPDGSYHFANDLQNFLAKLTTVKTVIVDESFTHFTGTKIESVAPLVKKYPNLIVIKSLSKDFGIAGLRLGYAVMSEKRVSALLERGYLWNVSGFGEYFLNLLSDKAFLKEYEAARLKAIGGRDDFFKALQKVEGIKVYPSKANAFLIELLDGTKAGHLMVRLLSRHGIYIRTCYDKVGLEGEFVRIASRTKAENDFFVSALHTILL